MLRHLLATAASTRLRRAGVSRPSWRTPPPPARSRHVLRSDRGLRPTISNFWFTSSESTCPPSASASSRSADPDRPRSSARTAFASAASSTPVQNSMPPFAG
ncbi:hypothetical protein K7G98_08995 [Saccharothrix sp. MB29]|nr:hypothetical protein [Saccharothrix sp. MB29]